ncbi:hypothetical protein [Butyrivibrio sp. VCD2006]|uniref:hypothetical protein n=1 Tax=Butyrivibrio sp. VCD2006 TaxID=1280664 RepID=UPI00047D47A2|nr:hypothetical protein [Butyrivibrio sp. VCD2006]
MYCCSRFTAVLQLFYRCKGHSNVLIPAGLDARERALILGHSVETNERYYSYAGTFLLEGIYDKLTKSSIHAV